MKFKEKLLSAISRKIDLHKEVIKNNGTRIFKCPECKEEIYNDEYTKGMIYAYQDVTGLVIDNDNT